MPSAKIASARLGAIVLVLFSAGAWAQTNGVLREVYYNINGSAVSDLINAPANDISADAVVLRSQISF